MHRLSIMDPLHGWQPFWTEDRSVGVLGNGEIYNAGELRAQLRARGHVLHTNSDIEVVPHLFEEFGSDAFGRLRGMFALVLIDKTSREVLLVRDRLGEKPLCYWQSGGAIYISSEQRALVRSGVTPLELDADLVGVRREAVEHGVVVGATVVAGVGKVTDQWRCRVHAAARCTASNTSLTDGRSAGPALQ